MENQIYKEEDFAKAKSQKKKILIFYFIMLSAYLLISVGVLLYYVTLPYRSGMIIWVKVIQYTITGIFMIFSFIYLSIKFSRIRKYCKVLAGIETGEVAVTMGSFFAYNESIEVKDGCDFKSLIFKEWNTKKQEFFDRKVLVDMEKDFPKFEVEENIKYYTHSNILVGYERA